MEWNFWLNNGRLVKVARLLSFLWLIVALANFPSAVHSADAGGVDAVLVIDSSGSMAKNDPDKLRVPAAKLFMSLLGKDDRVGLISFSDNGYPVLHLTSPDPHTSQRILASADRVSSRGVYTNLHAAVEKGIQMLDKEAAEGQEKMLVLMSDGKMDVGNAEEESDLTQKLQGPLLQQALDQDIKLYTIAFTEASDVSLLKKIAMESGGLFKLARSDRDLHDVFSGIFETAKEPDMLPVEGGEFVVDSSIEEVTIVASKAGKDARIYLQAPGGKKYSSDDAGENLKWFPSHHFDMITIGKPEPGSWKLLMTGGRNRAYIVTNMTLNHNPQNPALQVEQDMVLEAWLEEDGKLLNREAVLTNTRFMMEIRDPAGAASRFDLFDRGEYGDRNIADGIYANTIGYTNPGSYELSVIVEGETFRRQKTVHFEVAAPSPIQALPQAETESEPVIPQQPAEPVKEPLAEPEPEAVMEEPEEPVLAAVAESPVEEQAAAEQAAAPPAKKKGVSMGVAIGLFLGINLLLALIGLGVWWFLKKRKQKAVDDKPVEDGELQQAA